MRKDYFVKVVLQPENVVKSNCTYCEHKSNLTFDLYDHDRIIEKDGGWAPKFVGTYDLKSTNRKGIFLLEVPFKGLTVTYELEVTETIFVTEGVR